MTTVAPVSVFADDATFKIGGIGPVTGAAAIYGQAVKNATELAINEVNERRRNQRISGRVQI